MIYRNTPQWFVAIDKPLDDGMDNYGRTIRERALTSIDRLVHWTPVSRPQPPLLDDRGPPRLGAEPPARLGRAADLLREAPPDGTAEILRDPAVNARIKAAFETEGADAWFEEGAKARFLGNDHDPDEWEKVTDILDVWFDSGSTHAFALRDRPDGIWPASVYLEGTDQHRGWFHSSMLQACGTRGRAPYDAVVTHGFTLDENGMKMSKSLGNTTAPEDVIRQYGADILRLWVAQTDYAVDLRIGPEILKGTADSYRRLRNTLRFLLGALDGFDGGRARRARRDARARALGAAPAGRARPAWCARATPPSSSSASSSSLFQFCTVDLSAFYFDIRKDALYCDAADQPAPARRPHRARRPLPPPRRPGSRRCCPSPWRRSGSSASPARTPRCTWSTSPRPRPTGSTPPSPRNGSRSARPAASSPARWRSSGATSASAPASRRRPSCTSPTPPCARRSPRSTSPTSASPPT